MNDFNMTNVKQVPYPHWLKWTGLAICIATLILWIVPAAEIEESLGTSLVVSTDRQFLRIMHGSLRCGTSNYGNAGSYQGATWLSEGWRHEPSLRDRLGLHLPFINVESDELTGVYVPLWFMLVVIGMPTAYFFRRDKRQTQSILCSTCGYNLTGNVSGICPECGSVINQQRAAD